MHERLGELGIDVAVVYPSIGLNFTAQLDAQLRRRSCRAYNGYIAEHFAGLEDRLIPVAVIPTVTPDEAVEELDHAVEGLGLKTVVLGGFAVRPLEAGGDLATWIDPLGLDSVYDYDPLWARLGASRRVRRLPLRLDGLERAALHHQFHCQPPRQLCRC